MANTNIFGALGVADDDYAYLHTFGQSVVYDATLQLLGDHNDDMALAESAFIEKTTSDHAAKYKLPMGGFLQRRGNRSRTAEVKAAGEWAVGFPLEDFGADIAFDFVAWAYMTLPQYDLQLAGVMKQDANTRRFEVLRALFNNTARTFVDDHWPNITVQPLANGDGTVYPPIIGSYANSTANHYVGVAADTTTLNNANNPLPGVVSKLEGRFGQPTGGSKIVVFLNSAQVASAETLATFNPVPNRFVTFGANANLVEGQEGNPFNLPGRCIGESDSALLMQWDWIPAGYLGAVHLDAPRPLCKRVDPAGTGLGVGLQMRAVDFHMPFDRYSWSDRFGLGVGNRLNGVIVDLTAAGGAGTYTVPAQFA